jgi:hypothetical protein
VRKTLAEIRRETDVVLRASAKLLMGKRLEIQGPAKLVIYCGSSTVHRDDPFWYEHPGGRTYKRTAEEVIRAILPHVGFRAIDSAKEHLS